MTKFVLIVDSYGDSEVATQLACHKIVDDGRLWDLLVDAVAEEGGESADEDFQRGGNVEFAGTTAEHRRKDAITDHSLE